MTQDEVTFYIHPLEKIIFADKENLSIWRTRLATPTDSKVPPGQEICILKASLLMEISSREIQALIELQCVKISEVFPKKPQQPLHLHSFRIGKKKHKKYTSYVQYLPCSCGRDYSLHCEALTSAIISPGVNIKNACETTLDKIDPMGLGWGLILDLCQSFGDVTSWKMDSWIPDGQCPAGFEAIFSLCVCMTWTDMDRNTRFESRNHLGTSQASGFPASVFGSTGFKRSARRSL